MRGSNEVYGALVLRSNNNPAFFTEEIQKIINMQMEEASMLVHVLLMQEQFDAHRNRLIHDIRAPLLNIEDDTYTLVHSADTTDQNKQELINSIRKNSVHSLTLLNGIEILLGIAQIDFIIMKKDELEGLIERIWGLIEERYPQNVKFQYTVNVTEIQVDKSILATLLQNVLSNIKKYSVPYSTAKMTISQSEIDNSYEIIFKNLIMEKIEKSHLFDLVKDIPRRYFNNQIDDKAGKGYGMSVIYNCIHALNKSSGPRCDTEIIDFEIFEDGEDRKTTLFQKYLWQDNNIQLKEI